MYFWCSTPISSNKGRKLVVRSDRLTVHMTECRTLRSISSTPSLLAKRGVSQKIMDTLSHLALPAVALSLLFTVLHIVRSFIFWQNLPLISLFTPPGANQQSHPGNNGRSSLYWCQPCFVLKEQSGKEGSVCERTHLDEGSIAQRSEAILCDNEESDLPELLDDSPRLVRGPNNHSSLYNQWGPWFSWWWCW